MHLCLVFCGRIKDYFVVKAGTQLCSGRPPVTVLVDPCSTNINWARCQGNYLMLEETLQGCLAVLLMQTTLMRSLQHSLLHRCMVIISSTSCQHIMCMHTCHLLQEKMYTCRKQTPHTSAVTGLRRMHPIFDCKTQVTLGECAWLSRECTH